MLKVVVLGNGNVATHLCMVFEHNSNILLLQNYNRKGKNIPNCNVPVVANVDDIINADVYIIAYDDNALPKLYNSLNHLQGIVVHTSGATSIHVLNKFNNYGVFYPLYSFSKDIEIDFNEVPILVEANNKSNESLLRRLAESITNKVLNVNSEKRKILHVAAVFANNFTNLMFSQAKGICDINDIDFEVLKPLIKQTANKIDDLDPQLAQTGPAIRKDTKTIESHLAILNKTDQKEMYTFLTQAIQKYYEEKL